MSQSLANEFWSITQRLLVFEEPVAKWLRYQNSLKRIKRRSLPAANWNASDFDISKLVNPISPVTSNENQDNDAVHISSLFSILFAQEEARRFNKFAIQKWADYTKKKTAPIGATSEKYYEDNNCLPLWLEFNALSAPAWTALLNEGPWNNDPRTLFIIQILYLIKERFPQGSPNYLSDKAKWQSLTLEFQKLLLRARQNLPGNFLPDSILIVEGATEVILLPYLASCLGINMRNKGVMFINARGANQVAKKYRYLKDIISLPIYCLLDNDAREQCALIESDIRAEDRLFIQKSGEIEDMISTESLVSLLNGYLETLNMKSSLCSAVDLDDFPKNQSRKVVLEKLWRKRDLGKFDKVGFASFVVSQDKKADFISENGKQVIEALISGRFS